MCALRNYRLTPHAFNIGVRGKPERGMESLRMMGWGLVVVESSSAAAAVVAAAVPWKMTDLLINVFVTIGHHNRDEDVILPGN